MLIESRTLQKPIARSRQRKEVAAQKLTALDSDARNVAEAKKTETHVTAAEETSKESVDTQSTI